MYLKRSKRKAHFCNSAIGTNRKLSIVSTSRKLNGVQMKTMIIDNYLQGNVTGINCIHLATQTSTISCMSNALVMEKMFETSKLKA